MGKFSSRQWTLAVLIVILAVAGVFRFYALDRADVLTDEASVSFRSIGYFDFLASPYQTTPLEWLQTRPWWTYLSFHDHPFLNFLLQHGIFVLTGVSVWTMRLWPALTGWLSILFIYLIGRKLFNSTIGLVSAGLAAVNVYLVWISRLAMQEAPLILFMLISFYIFLKSLERPRWLVWLGLSLGLTLMIKLNGLILIPILVFYCLFWRRDVFRSKYLYWGAGLFMLAISPYLIYNFYLYQTFGHLDFQLSYLLKEPVQAWAIRPGRFEFPTLKSAFSFFFINLYQGLSLPFLAVAVGSFAFLSWQAFRPGQTGQSKLSVRLLLLIAALFFLFFMGIGPSRRFLAMLIPWLCLMVAVGIYHLGQLGRALKWTTAIGLAIFLAYESWFSFNTNIALANITNNHWLESRLKPLAYSYGYGQLEPYLDKLLADKKPAVVLPIANNNISSFVTQQTAKLSGQPEGIMLIYDPRFYGEAVLWHLTRRLIYQGWPVLSYDVYQQTLDNLGLNFFKDLGLTDFYYLAPTDKIILSNAEKFNVTVDELESFEQQLTARGDGAETIYNLQQRPVFIIYHFR